MDPMYLTSPDGSEAYLPIYKNGSTNTRELLTAAGWTTSKTPPTDVESVMVAWRHPYQRYFSACCWVVRHQGQKMEHILAMNSLTGGLWLGNDDHFARQVDFVGDLDLPWLNIRIGDIDLWMWERGIERRHPWIRSNAIDWEWSKQFVHRFWEPAVTDKIADHYAADMDAVVDLYGEVRHDKFIA
jgi:hypothetical protein